MANLQDRSKWDGTPSDAAKDELPSPGSGGGLFEIRVKGHLSSGWSDWLEGLEMQLLENGEMVLRGPIVDQAALMGILNKLGRLNLTLLSVNQAKIEERSEEE